MRKTGALLLMTAAIAAPARAAVPSAEAAVKATYLVKFGAYAEWPAQAAGGPFTICEVGRDSLGGALDQAAAGQTVNGRPVVVRRIEQIGPGTGCDLAYLSGSARQSVSAALAALRGTPVLTVTDARWSSARGMIHFDIVSNRVRFHIDDALAATGGIGISSKLLAIALSVRPRGGTR